MCKHNCGHEAMAPRKPIAQLDNWTKVGDYFMGTVLGHPRIDDGKFIRTSRAVYITPSGDIVETENTVYQMGEPAPSPHATTSHP